MITKKCAVLCMMLLVSSVKLLGSGVRLETVEPLRVPDPKQNGYLERPARVIRGEAGRWYVLDSEAKCLFVWDKTGRFLKRLGRMGKGPGEFEFGNVHLCHLAFDGEMVVVIDGRARRRHRFRNMEYVDSKPFIDKHGLIYFYRILANKKVLMRTESYRDNPPEMTIFLTDQNYGAEKVLYRCEITYFRHNADLGWDYVPFSRNPVIFADFFEDYFMLGNGVEPRLAVYNLEGRVIQNITLEIKPRAISSAEKQAVISETPWIRKPNRVFWPEQRELYSAILPLSHDILFVARAFQGHYDGGLYRNGKKTNTMVWQGGLRGGLFFSGGQLIAVSNAEEDIKIWQMRFNSHAK